VENSDTSALAVTRDYLDTIPRYYPNCLDSHDISKDTDILDTIQGYYPETGICSEHCLSANLSLNTIKILELTF
jgi:hypothetical protein